MSETVDTIPVLANVKMSSYDMRNNEQTVFSHRVLIHCFARYDAAEAKPRYAKTHSMLDALRSKYGKKGTMQSRRIGSDCLIS